MRARPVRTLSARECVARSLALREACRDGEARVAAALVRGPCVALGSRQRAAAVLRDVAHTHRATTGAEAWIGGTALWWTLALPRVNALMPDATAHTLLNRNVRGFLRGLTGCGALAHYFGRDVIAVRHKPAALLGYDLLDDGRTLIDVIAGWDEGVTLPAAHRAPRRARVDRPEGIALASVIPDRTPEDVAARVMAAVAARGGETLTEEPDETLVLRPEPDETLVLRGEVAVPIGWVEAGLLAGRPWLGGDLLASTAWLTRAEDALARGEALPEDAVLEGALPEDLLRAWA